MAPWWRRPTPQPQLPRLWRIEHLPGPRRRPVSVIRVALLALGALLLVLVVGRAGLEAFAVRKTAELLHGIPGTEASFERVRVTVLPPRWEVTRLKLTRAPGGGEGRPLFYAEHIEIDLSWRDLLRGRTVLDVRIDEPQLSLMRASASPSSAFADVRPGLLAMPAMLVRRLQIRGGQISVIDDQKGKADSQPSLWLHGIELVATGLTTRPPPSDAEAPPATVRASGRLQRRGTVSLSATLHPWAEPPSLQQVRGELRGLELAALLDAVSPSGAQQARGSLDLTLDAAVEQGELRGRLRVADSGARLSSGAASALDRQLGAWVEHRALPLDPSPPPGKGGFTTLRARIEDREAGGWPVLQALLRNAFVRGVSLAVEAGAKKS